ncbi:MAG: hypothetical protein ACLBM1_16295 [Cuspidothrix sp.]|jgi:hypothetical protein|uniref:DUF2281 domain-containing protein n=1 Tax=Cuspidothrix issatschenkoi CHARLIE-1 TaxID=2052836 RepID=A0A2S6CXN2_9CYAN|nr:hypothetical protein [Cuspidothrix issatschenkoi]PPJ64516.1 hypothetical protein CUN59_03770 [Cuspidothrix issatschenkoi CHARLIE-1]
MNNLTLENFFKQVDTLTTEEKIELINYLTRQIENQPIPTTSKNLVEVLQNSPLVGVDLDLERDQDFDNRNIEL